MHHVLLVDDEAAVTSSLQHEIDWDSLGLCVIGIAKNGVEALNIIQNNPIDILITDIRMAEMDGLSLSRQIFRMNQNIQIIIISGYAEFSYAQKALSYLPFANWSIKNNVPITTICWTPCTMERSLKFADI